jgi:hypothetical protein
MMDVLKSFYLSPSFPNKYFEIILPVFKTAETGHIITRLAKSLISSGKLYLLISKATLSFAF